MLPFLLSTQPYNRRLGDSVQECKCVCICVCRLVPLPGGKCWLLMSFFYSFHKTQSHRLNWASDSHSPVSLTVPLSWCVSLSLFLSLAMEKLIEEEKRQENFQWSPLAPYEVVQLRLKCNIYSSKTCVLWISIGGYLVVRASFCFACQLIIRLWHHKLMKHFLWDHTSYLFYKPGGKTKCQRIFKI